MAYSPKNIGKSVFLLFILSVFIRCTQDEPFLVGPTNMLIVDQSEGYSSINFDFARASLNNLPYESLSNKEEEGILFVREEEKVARDFYFAMNTLWNETTFEHLARSESTHFKASIIPIEKYLLADPVMDLDFGEFHSNSLTAFYDYLIIQGSMSIAAAYKTSALYEEANIHSLQNQLSDITNNQDLRLLYDNLLSATRNHLRVAVRHYESLGLKYIPQILTEETFAEIMDTGWDRDPLGG